MEKQFEQPRRHEMAPGLIGKEKLIAEAIDLAKSAGLTAAGAVRNVMDTYRGDFPQDASTHKEVYGLMCRAVEAGQNEAAAINQEQEEVWAEIQNENGPINSHLRPENQGYLPENEGRTH